MQARIRPVARYVGRMVLLTAALWAGCQGGEQSKGPAISPAATAEAAQIFSTRCMACHGPQGKGDGPASAGAIIWMHWLLVFLVVHVQLVTHSTCSW